MTRAWRTAALLGLATIAVACDRDFDPTAPYPGTLAIAVAAGDRQSAAPGSWLVTPLRALVQHSITGDPVESVVVEWHVVSGPGAVIEQLTSPTDQNGTAGTRVRLGSTMGDYVIEARFRGLRGEPARFTLYAAAK
jgi:hypothetical protein